jgi:hypothetical protein
MRNDSIKFPVLRYFTLLKIAQGSLISREKRLKTTFSEIGNGLTAVILGFLNLILNEAILLIKTLLPTRVQADDIQLALNQSRSLNHCDDSGVY